MGRRNAQCALSLARLSKGMFFVYYCAICLQVRHFLLLISVPAALSGGGALSLTTVGMMLGVRPLISMLSVPYCTGEGPQPANLNTK